MLSRLLAWFGSLRHPMPRPIHVDPRLAAAERWNGTVMSAETYR